MVDWPKSPVPLLIPKEWQTASNASSSNQQCVFQYDTEENLLKLVSHGGDADGTVIDVLDPEDIVAVNVEINMTVESATPVRATTGANSINDNSDSSRPSNAPPTDTPSDTQGHAALAIYAYPRQDPNNPNSSSSILRWCGMGKVHAKPNPKYQRPSTDTDEWQKWGHRFAFHRHLQVVPSEDMGGLNTMVKAIRQAAKLPDDPAKRGRALVIINPFSGPNHNAENMYETIVHTVLDQANVEHDVCVTTHAHYATERMAQGYQRQDDDTNENSKDISEYSALVCMGGDGIVYECLQGINERDDKDKLLKNLTFGIIGAGTSNGMAMSIARSSHEQSSILDASFLIAKGQTKQSDLSIYQTTNSPSLLSFLTFSWAMMSSIDIESEVLRFLGSLRFDLWGAWCVVKMRKYRAKFSYLPPKAKRSVALPAMTEPLPEKDGWVTEEDDYLLMWASHGTQVSCVVIYLLYIDTFCHSNLTDLSSILQ